MKYTNFSDLSEVTSMDLLIKCKNACKNAKKYPKMPFYDLGPHMRPPPPPLPNSTMILQICIKLISTYRLALRH